MQTHTYTYRYHYIGPGIPVSFSQTPAIETKGNDMKLYQGTLGRGWSGTGTGS